MRRPVVLSHANELTWEIEYILIISWSGTSAENTVPKLFCFNCSETDTYCSKYRNQKYDTGVSSMAKLDTSIVGGLVGLVKSSVARIDQLLYEIF